MSFKDNLTKKKTKQTQILTTNFAVGGHYVNFKCATLSKDQMYVYLCHVVVFICDMLFLQIWYNQTKNVPRWSFVRIQILCKLQTFSLYFKFVFCRNI